MSFDQIVSNIEKTSKDHLVQHGNKLIVEMLQISGKEDTTNDQCSVAQEFPVFLHQNLTNKFSFYYFFITGIKMRSNSSCSCYKGNKGNETTYETFYSTIPSPIDLYYENGSSYSSSENFLLVTFKLGRPDNCSDEEIVVHTCGRKKNKGVYCKCSQANYDWKGAPDPTEFPARFFRQWKCAAGEPGNIRSEDMTTVYCSWQEHDEIADLYYRFMFAQTLCYKEM